MVSGYIIQSFVTTVPTHSRPGWRVGNLVIKTCPYHIQIFFQVKIEDFIGKKRMIFVIIFAKNIDCGYALTASMKRLKRGPTIYVLDQT